MYQFFYSVWLFGLCLITLSFVLSAFFQKAKTMFIVAAVLLIVFAIVAYLVELLLIRLDAPYGAVLSTFLFAPVPFGHLLWTLSDGELKGTGWEEGLTRLEWGYENDYYYESYLFMHIDFVLYICLCLFLDSLIGDPLSFGRGPKDAEPAVNSPGKGITVKNMSIKFSWKEKAEGWAGIMGAKVAMEVQAVNGLDLEVDENSIFCLLGHNGAGKTTAMTLLSGLLSPDSGSAMVGESGVSVSFLPCKIHTVYIGRVSRREGCGYITEIPVQVGMTLSPTARRCGRIWACAPSMTSFTTSFRRRNSCCSTAPCKGSPTRKPTPNLTGCSLPSA
jgi:hypothetical protein